ncbi:ArsR family transcriptional regulator [Thiohalobacter sp. COW1]|uniref:Rhodanese-related sulfurtransferase n=1 Tax=Thiohalobacter thiocyanaticus TaxID=585455 RepID=A0A1Z4VRR3_9GAMM|nr:MULTISPECIES: metalloregulator ArsR/SmtB family transcription factor [Thiohalobacter]BAZ94028.1 rhodanese-related sulfurtransferase [Thiohalobacter thiocyanaticus]BCO30906.1 ArsR family transcriptional regulator [Thiohalobacter sp. COW1]
MSFNVKHALFTQFARVGKVLGNAHRLALIEYLGQGERSVEALAQVAGLSVANTSQHLQQLRQAGLVETRREGQRIYYRLSGEDVVALLDAMRRVANRHLAEIDQLVDTYLTVKDSMEPVAAQELMKRLKRGEVTVLDVRPEEEYAAGHLPGAVNIPLDSLEKQLAALPADREVIAYCRGPYCVLSYDAVAELRRRGYQARRLEEGYPEWRSAGLPVEETRH